MTLQSTARDDHILANKVQVSKSIAALLRRLLKIRGRIFSKEGGDDVILPSTSYGALILQGVKVQFSSKDTQGVLNLRRLIHGVLDPPQGAYGPTTQDKAKIIKQALSWIRIGPL